MSLLAMLERASVDDTQRQKAITPPNAQAIDAFVTPFDESNLPNDLDPIGKRWFEEKDEDLSREVPGFPAGTLVTTNFADYDMEYGWWPGVVIPQWLFRWFNYRRPIRQNEVNMGKFSPDNYVYVLSFGDMSMYFFKPQNIELGITHKMQGRDATYKRAIAQAQEYQAANPIHNNHIGQYVAYQRGFKADSRVWCFVVNITPQAITLNCEDGNPYVVPREEWNNLRWVGPPPSIQTGIWNSQWDLRHDAALARTEYARVEQEQRKRLQDRQEATQARRQNARSTRDSNRQDDMPQKGVTPLQHAKLQEIRRFRMAKQQQQASRDARQNELAVKRMKSTDRYLKEQEAITNEEEQLQKATRRSLEQQGTQGFESDEAAGSLSDLY